MRSGITSTQDLTAVVAAANEERKGASVCDNGCGVRNHSYQICAICLKSFKAICNTYMHAIRIGPTKVALLPWLIRHPCENVLGRNDCSDLAPSLLHSFANLLLTLTASIQIGGIDDDSAEAEKGA